jgi:hypothetical protein
MVGFDPMVGRPSANYDDGIMNLLTLSPLLGNIYYISGGTLLLIVIIVLLIRR